MAFIFYLGINLKVRLVEDIEITTFNIIPIIIFDTIFPIFIGFFLRLPKLIIEIKEKKQWSFDWIKFAAIGIPTLYIAIIPILVIYFGSEFIFARRLYMIGDTSFGSTAGIVFGYVLLDSLKKTNPQPAGVLIEEGI